MKLKPIVYSIALLGLSSSALAASAGAPATDRSMAAMDARINKLESILDQNQNRVHTGDPSDSWFNRIILSGELNVDGYWSSRTPLSDDPEGPGEGGSAPTAGARFGSDSSNDLSVADANLYLDVDVNSWTDAHIAWTYQDMSGLNNIQNHRHTLKGDLV